MLRKRLRKSRTITSFNSLEAAALRCLNVLPSSRRKAGSLLITPCRKSNISKEGSFHEVILDFSCCFRLFEFVGGCAGADSKGRAGLSRTKEFRGSSELDEPGIRLFEALEQASADEP